MSDLQAQIKNYLDYCQNQKRLDAKTDYQKRNALRDAAVIELLFATGMRISELCSLEMDSVTLYDRTKGYSHYKASEKEFSFIIIKNCL